MKKTTCCLLFTREVDVVLKPIDLVLPVQVHLGLEVEVHLPVEAQHLVHLGLVLTFPLPGYKTLHKGLILIDTKIKHYV